MRKIILTGGGTAGHVTPNIALIPELQSLGYEISYIGSYDGIEKGLIEAEDIPYYGISSGKLRRYFDWKNFSDPFRVIKGFFEAKKLMKSLQPDIVFSKGGFVSVPVVFAAHKCHIPVIIHESDMTPGLANKLAFPKASKVCCNFPETMQFLPEGKAVLSGSPIRRQLMEGSRARGLSFLGFTDEKPILLVMGGSIGSKFINNAVRESLNTLLNQFQIVHLCGKGNVDEGYSHIFGYAQYEYISDQLADIFAATDIMVSRAGANSICEILALKIPNILIPLSAAASRGDQILNSDSFKKQGFSEVIHEEELTAELFTNTVQTVYENRLDYITNMTASLQKDAIQIILELIKDLTK